MPEFIYVEHNRSYYNIELLLEIELYGMGPSHLLGVTRILTYPISKRVGLTIQNMEAARKRGDIGTSVNA